MNNMDLVDNLYNKNNPDNTDNYIPHNQNQGLVMRLLQIQERNLRRDRILQLDDHTIVFIPLFYIKTE